MGRRLHLVRTIRHGDKQGDSPSGAVAGREGSVSTKEDGKELMNWLLRYLGLPASPYYVSQSRCRRRPGFGAHM